MIKSRMIWVGHIERIVIRNAYKNLVGKSERKRPLGNLGLDGKIILKWILGK
jgi:hypothetical protein